MWAKVLSPYERAGLFRLVRIVRFDELFHVPIIRAGMSRPDDVLTVQRLYPQIFVACHTNHVRAASTEWRISSQDASILVHLSPNIGLSPRSLAVHLGIRPSTLSAAIARLSRLGYLSSQPAAEDKRKRELRLTERGAQAIAATSVLDADRVRLLLAKLKRKERVEALRGLELLAEAARKLKD
jgi:DNA-binding MarR family transcriptional regulator